MRGEAKLRAGLIGENCGNCRHGEIRRGYMWCGHRRCETDAFSRCDDWEPR